MGVQSSIKKNKEKKRFNLIDIDKDQLNYKVKINKENCKFFKNSKLSNIVRKLLKYILQIYNN